MHIIEGFGGEVIRFWKYTGACRKESRVLEVEGNKKYTQFVWSITPSLVSSHAHCRIVPLLRKAHNQT